MKNLTEHKSSRKMCWIYRQQMVHSSSFKVNMTKSLCLTWWDHSMNGI